MFLIQALFTINLCNHSSQGLFQILTVGATTLFQFHQCSINLHCSERLGFGQKEDRGSRKLAKKSTWAFLLNVLLFPVSSGLFFSKIYFMYMLAQWQNLALSICKVYREKKRMHLLDPKAEPYTGGMTFLGKCRAKSSAQLPLSQARAALTQTSEEAAGRALSWGESSLLWSKRG